MNESQKLSESEFSEMLRLIHRFSVSEMDQWEQWKFDSEFGKVFVSITRQPSGPEEAYAELTHMLGAK